MNRTFAVLVVAAAAGACQTVGVPVLAQSADWAAIRTQLENVKTIDQAARMELVKLESDARAKGIAADAVAKKSILDRMAAQDKANQARVFQILDQYGWPPQSRVGTDASIAAFLVVQHAELKDQQKYIALYRNAAAAGEAAKSNLALLEDRILIREGKKQRYGTQADTKYGVSILPTEDEDTLDARRKDMGLPPICDYLKFFVRQFGKVTYAKCVAPPAPN